jgi:hypothetical protein
MLQKVGKFTCLPLRINCYLAYKLNKPNKQSNNIYRKKLINLYNFQAGYRWAHISNRQVILEPTNLLLLHEFERLAIQKLAAQKLNASDLGINVRIPKG